MIFRRLFCLFLALLLTASALGQSKEDQALLDEMNRKIRDLQMQAYAASDNLERFTSLQDQVMGVVRDTLAKVSPKARPALEIGLTLMGPLHEESNAYLKLASSKIEGGLFDFTTVAKREEIAPRIEQLQDLKDRNERLRVRVDRIDDEVKRILESSPLSKAEQRAFREGFNQEFGRRVGPMKAVRTLDSQLFDLFASAFRHLDQHWGAWKVSAEGPLEWNDEAAGNKFEELIGEIQEVAERQAAAEQLLNDRIQTK